MDRVFDKFIITMVFVVARESSRPMVQALDVSAFDNLYGTGHVCWSRTAARDLRIWHLVSAHRWFPHIVGFRAPSDPETRTPTSQHSNPPNAWPRLMDFDPTPFAPVTATFVLAPAISVMVATRPSPAVGMNNNSMLRPVKI